MSSNLLDKKLEYWEHQLLDLGKRNRMINYKEYKRATIKLVEPSFRELFDKIALKEETLTFQRSVDRETDIRVFSILSLLENLSFPLPVTIGDIKTEGSILERQRTLKNLRSKSRLALEEQGTNILYLSFGFIEWKNGKGASASWIKSPLVLVPVVLSLEALNSPYTLKKHEDDIVVNPTLEYFLKTEYGIELPHFDVDKQSIDEYLISLEEIADQRGWRVLREVSLGLLSFLKISMYSDLMRNKERIKKNPVIRAMAGDTSDANDIPERLRNFNLDSIKPQDCYQVMSADSSQQDAILYSKNNISFVMQGPPGTGKSQTITNIIAEALAEGKKVLFVSEKMAALQVVYRRLQEAHLGDFCLPLHSYKANKKEILEQIGANLKLKQTRVKDEAINNLEELLMIRQELNKYAEELHTLNPKLNISCYDVYSKLEEVQSFPSITYTIANPLDVTQAELQAYLNRLKEYSLSVKRLNNYIKDNPWEGLSSRTTGYEYSEKMSSELNQLYSKITVISNLLDSIIESKNLSNKLSYSDIPLFADLLNKIGSLSIVPDFWFADFDIPKAKVIAQDAEKNYQKHFELQKEIEKVFTTEIYSHKYNEWKEDLLKIAESFTSMPLVKEDSPQFFITNASCILENVNRLKEKFSIVVKSFSAINDLLGTNFVSNPHNQQIITELLMLIEGNVILHKNWFKVDLGKVKSLVNEAKVTAQELQTQKSSILNEWEPEVLSLDYSSILTRYKTKYTSAFKIFNSQYRKDKNQLRALSKNIIKKLPDDVAVSLLNSLKTYHEKENWFTSKNAELSENLLSYYSGSDSDWDYILAAISIVEKLSQLPVGGISSDLIEILSADHKAQITTLESLLTTLVSTFSDVRAIAINNQITLNIDSLDFNAEHAIKTADNYIVKLNELLNQKNSLNPYLLNDDERIEIVYDTIEKLNCYVALLKKLSDLSMRYKQQFEFLYKGKSTNWKEIIDLLEKVEYLKTSSLCEFVSTCANAPEKRKQELIKLSETIATTYKNSTIHFEWINNQFATNTQLNTITIHSLTNKINSCSSNINILENWIDYQEAKEECNNNGLHDFIEKIEQNKIFEDVDKVFLKGFYHMWLGAVCDKSTSIRRFRRNVQDERIKKFIDLDDLQLRIAQMRIREKLIENLPSTHHMLKATDELAILNKELNKKKKIMPLRKLFKLIPNLLLKLKPCLMMSPLSVSYFLETEAYHFDLVIFDEASQIFPEDAIGAIFRGSQVIIAGDSKQLPPTNFFASTTNNVDSEYDIKDDEDFSEVVSDSILEESASVLPNRTLLWHYRSKHESLIAFSNREIYKNNLITFPNSINNVADMGVEYIYVENGIYDRGGKKNNLREAEECVRLVFEHIDKYPDRSLGIIAFSESQQTAIENAIIDYRERNPEYEWFFDESKDEPFFIKNLENVQGDERDTIIFSICYGKDKNGAMYMNFGPVGHSGGERRLNVAITRAKCNVKLVGSILPSDIDINRAKSEGARMLRAYIEYARKGTSALKPVDKTEAFESNDDFCEIIAEFLEAHGYSIERQVGCSDYKIDIAIKNPHVEGEFLVGIECDGLSYIHAKTARDRDHLRKSVLQNMGWNLYRVWSTEWNRNPKAEGEALLKYIESIYDKDGITKHVIKQSNDDDAKYSVEDIAFESIKAPKIVSDTNPYGFSYYKEANWWEAERTGGYDNLKNISENVVHIVKIEQPIHKELLYKRLGPSFTAGKATEAVKITIAEAIEKKLKSKISVDKDNFVRLLPLTDIVPRIPEKYATPRPMEYIHTQEVAIAMIRIVEESFGITEEDLATECARAFGFERKGPKIKAKTDAAIKWLIDNKKIRIIDGKAQLIGD